MKSTCFDIHEEPPERGKMDFPDVPFDCGLARWSVGQGVFFHVFDSSADRSIDIFSHIAGNVCFEAATVAGRCFVLWVLYVTKLSQLFEIACTHPLTVCRTSSWQQRPC